MEKMDLDRHQANNGSGHCTRGEFSAEQSELKNVTFTFALMANQPIYHKIGRLRWGCGGEKAKHRPKRKVSV